jgi:hypothetical protein
MKNLFAFFLFAVISSLIFADDSIEIQKQENKEYGETYYGIDYHGCRLIWTLHRAFDEPIFGFKEESSKCNLPLEQQMPLRAKLLEKIIADTNNMQGVQGFSWGRLKRGDATDEYARRFVIAVSKSPYWDKRKGKAVGEGAKHYSYLPNLINSEHVFSELTALFSAHGLTLQATDFEEIFVGNVDIKEAGITKKDKLPIDGSLVFKVTKKAGKR